MNAQEKYVRMGPNSATSHEKVRYYILDRLTSQVLITSRLHEKREEHYSLVSTIWELDW